MPVCFAYYCSGHGYGHATRVSAFASQLLSLPESIRPMIFITSSAPKMVFSGAIACGAQYRESLIDPVIVQPVAYQIDRKQSIEVLKGFLSKKTALLSKEVDWLKSIQATCILTDAAFLGCLAANALRLPSILITNFSFDSIYSFLATSIPDSRPENLDFACSPEPVENENDDEPICISELRPLVDQIWDGYRCADLLLLLPGHIPIPSFWQQPSLPSSEWIDPSTSRPYHELTKFFGGPFIPQELYPPVAFPGSTQGAENTLNNVRTRGVFPAPLIVRSPSKTPSPYSQEGRSKFLASIGVPPEYHVPTTTKILVVSFGGQAFQRPSKSGSRTPSSRDYSPEPRHSRGGHRRARSSQTITPSEKHISIIIPPDNNPSSPPSRTPSSTSSFSSLAQMFRDVLPSTPVLATQPLATPTHFFIPGAPPVARLERSSSLKSLHRSPSRSPTIHVGGFSSPIKQDIPSFATTPPTPIETDAAKFQPWSSRYVHDDDDDDDQEELIELLPDENWIAIVCGVSKEQWLAQQNDEGEENLPDRFFVAPRDVYMPDLTAIGDVLLGKLGYGSVAECVDACTSFVYVSRPLFIEEHGLRQYLTREGTGVELSRECYELGDWAGAIGKAYQDGQHRKAHKRLQMGQGIHDVREQEVKVLAKDVIGWVEHWHRLYS